MKTCRVVFFLFVPFILKGQTISTIAGSGANSFSGNGTPAVSAGIPNPIGGTFDKYGNYYFADAVNSNRIRKINPSGTITTVAGNGMGGYSGDGAAATLAKLLLPNAVKVDTLGNLYIADANNHRIRKVDALTQVITTFAGTGTGSFSGDNVQATATNLFDPLDLCIDKWGNIFVADAQNYRIRKITPAGIITTIAGNGTPGGAGDGGAATLAQLSLPEGVAVDDTGNIYIADRGAAGCRVRKVNLAGTISTFAGNGATTYIGDGIPATAAQIVPIKIGFDTSWQLFIADDYNERIYKVDLAGILHLVAGTGVSGYTGDGGPATAADILYPSGIAFDPCGNLYFPVVTHHHIRKVTFNPTCDLSSLEAGESKTIYEISIYPNPVYSELIITSTIKIRNIAITDLIDQTLFNQEFNSQKAELNISGFPQGIYMIKVTDEMGVSTIKKIIKQ